MQDLDPGVGRGLVAAGPCLDHPALVLLAREAEKVGVGAAEQDPGCHAGHLDGGRLAGLVVRLGFGRLGQFRGSRLVARAGNRQAGQRNGLLGGLAPVGQGQDRGRAVESTDKQALAVPGQCNRGGPVGLAGEVTILSEPLGGPGLDRQVLAGTDQVASVGRELQVEQRGLVGEAGVANRVGSLAAVPGDLPGADAVVDASGDDESPVGRDRHGVLALGRFVECVESLSGLEVPELDGAIATGRGQEAAPGVKGHVGDRTVVTAHLHAPFPAGRLPDDDRAVVGSGGQQGGVGGERHGVEAVGVTANDAGEFRGLFRSGLARVNGDVVDPGLTEQARFSRSSHQSATVGRKRQVADLAGQPRQRRQWFGPADMRQAQQLHLSGPGHRVPASVGRDDQGVDRLADLPPGRNAGHCQRRGRVGGRKRLGTAGDPGLEHRDLRRARAAIAFRRHERLAATFDQLHQQAGLDLARHHRRTRLTTLDQARMSGQHQPALGVLGVVTADTVLLENRLGLGCRPVGRPGRSHAGQQHDGGHEDREPGLMEETGHGKFSIGSTGTVDRISG